MKLWIRLAIFLVPALAATWFVLWRFSPEQAVLRHADLIFTCAEKGPLRAGTPREKAARLTAALSPDIKIQAPHPLPSGSLSSTRASRMLVEFQNSILSCKISRENEEVAFSSPDLAVYRAIVSAEAAQGPGRRYHMRYQCRIEFTRSGREWLAGLIELEAI